MVAYKFILYVFCVVLVVVDVLAMVGVVPWDYASDVIFYALRDGNHALVDLLSNGRRLVLAPRYVMRVAAYFWEDTFIQACRQGDVAAVEGALDMCDDAWKPRWVEAVTNACAYGEAEVLCVLLAASRLGVTNDAISAALHSDDVTTMRVLLADGRVDLEAVGALAKAVATGNAAMVRVLAADARTTVPTRQPVQKTRLVTLRHSTWHAGVFTTN